MTSGLACLYRRAAAVFGPLAGALKENSEFEKTFVKQKLLEPMMLAVELHFGVWC
jgi:hypothetical protein